MSIEDGPYLAAALLCEKVLVEKDEVLSAIRIVDRIVHTARGASAPELMPPLNVDLRLLLVFKSGPAHGSRNVSVRLAQPSGRVQQPVLLPIFLEGGDGDRGANLLIEVRFQALEDGLYWFDILLNEELITRVPLRIVYQRLTVGTSGATPVH